MVYRINAWAERSFQRLLARSYFVLLLVLLLGSQRVHAQMAETLGEAWRWVQFTTASGLPSNQVLDVVETTTGTVWARMMEDLAWYDGFRWQPITAAEGLPEGPIGSVMPDMQGGLLVLINRQLYQGDEQGFTLLPVEHEGVRLQVESVVPLDEEGFLLRSAGRLYRYGSDVVERFMLPDEIARARPASLGGLRRTRDGTLWLNSPLGLFEWIGDGWIRRFETNIHFLHADTSGGIMTVNGKQPVAGLWTWTPGRPLRHLDQSDIWIVAMDVDQQGEAVLAYTDDRVRLRQGGRWQWLRPVPDPMTNVRCLRFQRNGDLWVGTGQGLFLHRSSSTRWTRARDAGAQVSAILRTQRGELWGATNEGVFIRRPGGTTERITSIGGTPLLALTGLAEDLDGGIWISSGSGFTGAYRWYEGAWQHVGPEDGLQATYVHKIIPDQSGKLWFLGQSATYGGTAEDPEPGAFVYEEGRFTRWGPEEGLLHGRAYAFVEGPDGARWFGTLGGLSRWKDGQWTHWTMEEGLKYARVFTLAVGPTGRVWFGHQGGHGLGLLDEQERPQYLTIDDGLIDNRVWNVKVNADSALWVATQGGLSRYRDGTFSSFGLSTGLAHPHIWPILPLHDLVYVGSVGGGMYELSLEEVDNPPPFVEVSPPLIDAGDAFFRWQAFAYRGEVPPEQIETRYRLDDEPWSQWGATREAIVRNVSAERHTFVVQARSLFGNVRAEGTTVTFRITPPFYQHPLFLSVVALWLASLLGVGVSYWRRQQRFVAEIEARNLEIEVKNVELETRNAEIEARNSEIEVKNVELEMRNAEMERFTYTVSHDLKSPLVTIKGFLGLLEQDAARGDTERMKRDMEQIGGATDKMHHLLSELLELSRVGRLMNPPEAVSLTELAREAASMVAGQIVARGVAVEIDPEMPVVLGDRVRLLEVYQNLVDNAVKFMGDQAAPRVEIGTQQHDGEVVCYVQDNGIGINPRYHETVFGLFERLDAHEEGTGIGLALVKRIVEVHGGRIWVESEGEGHGSTFYFTLPTNASAG